MPQTIKQTVKISGCPTCPFRHLGGCKIGYEKPLDPGVDNQQRIQPDWRKVPGLEGTGLNFSSIPDWCPLLKTSILLELVLDPNLVSPKKELNTLWDFLTND
jgi:hypothetical protein